MVESEEGAYPWLKSEALNEKNVMRWHQVYGTLLGLEFVPVVLRWTTGVL